MEVTQGGGEGGGGSGIRLYQILKTPLNFELSFVGMNDVLRYMAF